MKESVKALLLALCVLLPCGLSGAKTAAPAAPAAQSAAEPQQPASPKGKVLFQSHGEPPLPASNPEPSVAAATPVGPELTDQERSAVVFAAYDLDARMMPVTSHLAMRARVTVRNAGIKPLDRIAMQISSTLTWESATLVSAAGSRKLELAQHLLDTDADHTGKANELVLVLPEPLGAGKSVQLDTFYSGTIAASGGRLERIGATHGQALATDWDEIGVDEIGEDVTALRGFGDVLWYPVASPQLFLGDGAQLFDAVGATKLRESAATIRLRLAVIYRGDPPVAAYFCGRRWPLIAVSDDSDAPIASGEGIASAEFAAEPLGFRLPSLFLVSRPESLIAPSDAAGGKPLLAVETGDDGSLPALTTAADKVAPLLQEWLGAQPLSALTIVDHAGQPFEDGPLLVAPASSLAVSTASPALVHSLTHAWVQTGRPWMDEGLAQFFALLWTEREQGREAAMAQLGELIQPLSIAEPAIEPPVNAGPGGPGGELSSVTVGQPLIAATSELYYRRKAAAVWWMLRGIVGDETLEAALQTWRVRGPAKTTAEQDALVFEALLERSGPKNAQNPIDLHWFFDAWVLHDRGLPDLSIVDVTPRELPAGKGHNTGWLVAVTVRNEGAASAEVPVTIRGATFSTTSRLRVAGFASATARVIVEAQPSEVLVNDGSTPEVRTSLHKVAVNVRQQ